MWYIAYISMILGLYVFKSAWAAFAIYHGLILIVLYKSKYDFKQLLRGWNTKIGLASILFGLLGGVILYTLAPQANITKETIQPTLTLLGLTGTSWLLFIIYHSTINPWFEEALWRGKLAHKSKKPVIHDITFALYHALVLVLFLDWHWILLSLIMLISAAWLWRQLANKYKGLLTPITSHIAADASIMIAIYLILL